MPSWLVLYKTEPKFVLTQQPLLPNMAALLVGIWFRTQGLSGTHVLLEIDRPIPGIERRPARFTIFHTNLLVFDTQFLVLNTKFIISDAQQRQAREARILVRPRIPSG